MIRETGSDTLKRRNLIADFGITYTLAPGVNLVTSLQYANFDKGRGQGPAFKDGHAYALEYGIQVRF